MSTSAPQRRTESPRSLAVLLVVASVTGFVAAMALTMDKLTLLAHPHAALSCNFSVLVGCSTGLQSWQGSLLGFPNSILGMAAWAVLLALGMIMLTSIELTRVVWIGLNVGLAGAFGLVVFLIIQSIYVLGVLCPWCMATWAVTIPIFLAVTAFNLERWSPSTAIRAAGRIGMQWLPLITVACYVTVAALAQVRLDVLERL